jgi:polar amino acid transport system permease protein
MGRFFIELLPYLLKGLPVTLSVSILAFFIGAVIGITLSVLRVYGRKPLQLILLFYSTLFRSIPQIVLLILLYFAIAGSINLNPYWSAVFALSLISSAYQMEIFRGAFQSISSGQMMAARAIGMSRLKAVLVIMIPQAIRRALPAWTNEAALTIKASSLVYVLGIPELLRQAQYDIARSREPFPAYVAVGLLYFILVNAASKSLRVIENKLQIPGLV